ncbi:MAG: AGE family epimerase/isomerase [Pseudomonadota bacterium]
MDIEAGGFHEKLDQDLRPVVRDGKRGMVQARQIYTFAQSGVIGALDAGTDTAAVGRDFLLAHFAHPDGGWRFRVSRDGRPADDTRDLYTQAFVLFALSWLHRTGDRDAHAHANRTLAFLDDEMSHPQGGYREAVGGTPKSSHGERRQNPHMHLFEALLDWHEATGDRIWLDRSRAMAELLDRRFVVDGSLREFFDDGLRPAPGPTGQHVEPGHHYEWVWLLHRFRALGGGSDFDALALALYDFAERHGIDAEKGEVLDAVTADGAPLQRGRRLWPQTEAIKAHIARFEATGDDAFIDRMTRQAGAFHKAHIAGAPTGAWREHLDAEGKLLLSGLPASSLYHVTVAGSEIRRLSPP